ncbi:branched-chain amino acid ABC transporter permease [Desulfoferrobacter suflitae]|uniref:branched-chain amino acid ABC transporter permease n=1 Tax=Desulfoferrobacter suflitae TaxID=2865782 RepID=UPI002164EA99|nr:branched-chain amino acid ABC transporter permease [Desulfoferrobacter suflitae]MCK8604027.1 branched-chain amino acid ABC transporter permease [Desulfoferrobacter suflitae]
MYYLQLVINGIIAGSMYALFAVGLTMVYGVFRFINFAHGELIALGAYSALFFTSPPLSLPLIWATAPAVACTVCVGLLQDRLVFQPLCHGTRMTLLIASIGLSYLLRNAIQFGFGSDLLSYNVDLAAGYEWGPIIVTRMQLSMLITAVVFLTFLYWLFTRTMLGKALRAVADNMELAGIMGIPLGRVNRTVWILAATFAAVGGILLAMDTSLEPMMGVINLLKAFAAVLLGGPGNVWGALIGGIAIGVAENLSVAVLSPGYKDFIAFAVILVMLLFRPGGIFSFQKGMR